MKGILARGVLSPNDMMKVAFFAVVAITLSASTLGGFVGQNPNLVPDTGCSLLLLGLGVSALRFLRR